MPAVNPIQLIHVDQDLIVVNKPAGLAVLPEGWQSAAPYLTKELEAEFGRIWVVHRLDKLTSGVMLFARSVEAHRSLNSQFERRQARKIYHAIMTGVPGWDEKTARHALLANVGHRHRTVVSDRAGKPSETHFKVLKRYPEHALIEARPTTGRTHQVRVHAFALGYPLLGDALYGNLKSNLIGRPALHALSLSFFIPPGGDWSQDAVSPAAVTFTAPYPSDFENVLIRFLQTTDF